MIKNQNFKRNSHIDDLIKDAVNNNEGVIGLNGALMVDTGEFSGRIPNDKFIVDESSSTEKIWWGEVNQKLSEENFDYLLNKVLDTYENLPSSYYVFDGFAGDDKDNSLNVRMITKKAWQSLFVNNMFIRPSKEDLNDFRPDFTIINAYDVKEENWKDYGLNSENFIVFNIEKKIAIIGGTEYAGEMKKGIFSMMHYYLPMKNVLSMHCSANVGADDDSAILFGLSGTGKTTLSADPDRLLIGDDEHVWTDLGVSNFEDGCYAKLIDLDKEAEPVIAAALSMKGTLIDNVPPLPGKPIEETNPQELDLFDGSRTENTRFAYPLTCNPGVATGAAGPHPKTIVLLTADAFGVLPPVSILSPDEVMYHFVTGFTSKLAGTEVGVTKPEATFSACFGGPFMSQKPSVYAELLAKRMSEHDTRCILLNTGWTGGPHGVGSRMSLKHTRTLLNAALSGDFDESALVTQPILNLRMPTSCEGVPDEILNPRETWDDPSEYDEQASKLREMFRDNYKKKNFADLGIAAVM